MNTFHAVQPIYLQTLMKYFYQKDWINFFTPLNNDSKITMGTYLQHLNPYHAIGHILYPMKTSESLWFKDVFRE